MGKPTGFLEIERKTIPELPPKERIKNWNEFKLHPEEKHINDQGARCMECGTPYCHIGMMISGMASGCPVNNLIPEFNDLVYKKRYREALERLLLTNNFPEFTGRVCPAPCEGSCVLGYLEPAVTIKNIESFIIDHAWEQGWMTPRIPTVRTGKKIAVIGSGPAGLAAADHLNQAGHTVTVFERADRPGGLLMYGIPNMKLDKNKVVIRRVDLMKAEGVNFVMNANVGVTIKADDIKKDYDAVVLCAGSTLGRDLNAPGRELNGIHLAMEFLTKNTKHILDTKLDGSLSPLNAKDKNVVVIGGGDTGTDCVATSIRQGCKNVVQLEIMPCPPEKRALDNPWPEWPKTYKLDYGQEERAALYGTDPREYLVMTEKFIGDDKGNVKAIEVVNIEWVKDEAGRMSPKKIESTRKTIPADLVTIAMGFIGPESKLAESFGVSLDPRTNFSAEYGNFSTNVKGVFAAGDCRRGQSLVVWAINEGRAAAKACDAYLMGETCLK